MRFYDCHGVWEATSEFSKKKGYTFEVPSDYQQMKKYFIKEFKIVRDCLKKTQMITIAFGHNKGKSGVFLNMDNLR